MLVKKKKNENHKKGYKAYQGFRSGSEQQMIQNILFKKYKFDTINLFTFCPPHLKSSVILTHGSWTKD